MSETTARIEWNKCSYCGHYHTYSSEMCRDKFNKEESALANEGLKSYAKGLAKEDSA